MEEEKSNKRIIKNTLFLYFRMFISLALSVITGRVVFQTLGVEDYGINAVVGGVIGMFSVIQSSMIGATARFITYEMGKKDNKLSAVFSTTLTVHIIIAFVLFIVLETIGLWIVNYQLEIPTNRMFAANCIYQFSIISTMLAVTQTPYSSILVAHEKMNVYAYFDILNTLFKLLIIYLLLIGNYDKLILYGFLTLCVSVFILILNRIYCIKRFPETHYHFIWDKTLLKPIISFSGWDVFGNVAVMARGQGVTILLNIFFGPIMNAAAGIANSVTSIISGFSGNIIMAVRPQLIKRYANGKYDSMIRLMHEGIVFSFVLMTFLTIPLIAEIHFVLKTWLGEVPEYACIFTILVLIFNIIGCFARIVMIVVHATGHIKKTSIINGVIYIMVLPVSYIAFKLEAPAWIPFLYNAIAFFCGSMWNTYLMTTYIPQLTLKRFFFNTIVPCFTLFIIVSIPVITVTYNLEEGWYRLFISIGLTIVLTSYLGYKFMLDENMKVKAKNIIMEKLNIK